MLEAIGQVPNGVGKTMRSLFSCFAAAIVLSGSLSVSGEEERSLEKLALETRILLQSALGDPDPANPCRLAAILTFAQLMSAVYTGSRVERLVALDAAGCLDDPWPILPYAAALMGARERPVASRATLLLLDSLSEVAGKPTLEVVEGQVTQLAGQLLSLARDARIDLDIRASALAGVQLLQVIGNTLKVLPLELLEDSDAVVRSAGLALLEPPIEEPVLIQLAKIVKEDEDFRLRGQAASLLCENALAHGVRVPSADLTAVMESVLGNYQAPADAAAAVLSCLANFPTEARVDLIDLAVGHPDPSVKEFWRALNKR